ncbi:Protein STRUBBELIG-RECEPTOR FAMILY 6 [Capsicum chinense]|uniref:Protein STRUBBELIG-RECEPTOR FAMILY 6 n=1 Tax=Capsicum annuum TaxID=4072 RepID=A0A1U8FLP8_CAPAN|nr:protein STRUBBELIG-RECEPTOR FAMILY 8 [Capsicum annuum]KAF3651622.1 Protein STRUBBELIG-RECEPTOR FAMILY 6 [Capsicum annuum]PHT90816.1 Protein STRUBBELIG-RECEPTOR FAMILY 6 [Capsicum annuum]PHU26759.1 Protein STRUBBELIG-RECEPTOR FAMILY 6 [Capsicum chinense]
MYRNRCKKDTLFPFLPVLVILAVFFESSFVVEGNTDPKDVQALQVLYASLNSPSQLSNWKSNGGDPCGESWKGVICLGASVVSIKINDMGLNGTLGYMLDALTSLKNLDMSGNNIHDSFPYQLPPNLTSLNLANNNISGTVPYSVAGMVRLSYLNLSHNSLSQTIGDVFTNHSNLVALDLSSNNFSGDLPPSFSTLTNLSVLRLQNNQLSGTLNILVGLPLTNLNVAKNRFNGWIPNELLSIPNFMYDGNSFANGPAPPPPPYTAPPPGRSRNNRTHSPPNSRTRPGSDGQPSPENGNEKKRLTTGAIIGIALGSSFVILFALAALVFCIRRGKDKEIAARPSTGSLPVGTDKVNLEVQEQRAKPVVAVADLKPPPTEKVTVEMIQGKNGSVRRVKSPITASSYTVAALQTATNSFSQENLIGEGSLGRVYRAEFPNGKIMVIKKIDSAALSLQEEDNFLEAVSNMSRLRHPNIVQLIGYCAEHGQRLLVYDHVTNGSLHDMLHFADERSELLTWNARVRVALGTARALEYLHEVCLPSVVHRNFKSANILLDEELNPHLSDCGLAALTPNTERQVSSTQMVGSFGYSAPEFALSGIYTVKSDVYSFGVVMLELLTGRKPLDSSRVRSEQSLVRWATPQLHDIDALSKMVDPALNGMYPAKSLSRFADIIALCVQPEPEFRPPMSEVVQALVRLMQRASVVKRRSSDESAFTYKTPEHETADMP